MDVDALLQSIPPLAVYLVVGLVIGLGLGFIAGVVNIVRASKAYAASHPVAPVEAVDPRDFRISWVFSTRYQGYYGGQYDSTQYRDPNVFGYYDYPMALRVGALVLESDVELKLEFELSPW